ncbi:MAG: UDP-N-acetylglucosamine 2-epimerase (non-hydrolyzing) [Lachnospiraceae bacterium]|nr:UDP-N-acetylglucosamine 2-epimerase (non-hydrolyzing) [Lachnospiraceae bacterium]
MKKVMVIFGTRPEAIKMCPVVKELKKHADEMQTVVCVTGQHREMLQQVLQSFSVVPDYDLAVMKPGQTLFDITTAILQGMKTILEKEKPDLVLVHGDTSTAFAAALAAFYMDIPVGHVEAGLRTWDIHAPYPEEFNRQAVGSIAALHFSPTEAAADNLRREKKDPSAIFVTGNTSIDALATTVREDYQHPVLRELAGRRLVLLTAHRRENLGEPLHQIFRGIRRVLELHPEVSVVYPVHLNPAVRKAAEEELGDSSQVRLIEPLDVIDFHNFMSRAELILTDSGGIQEEAPALGKPVLVLRDTTERPEGAEAGTLRLVGTEEEAVYSAFRTLLEDRAAYEQMAQASNPYGDGTASVKIVKILRTYFQK